MGHHDEMISVLVCLGCYNRIHGLGGFLTTEIYYIAPGGWAMICTAGVLPMTVPSRGRRAKRISLGLFYKGN